MEGKIVLITGASDGIGKQAAYEMAELGAHVIMHGRNKKKTEEAAADIRLKTGNETINVVLADLSSLQEIKKLGKEIHSTFSHIDVLVHNAGVQTREKQITSDGYEMMFAVNHLAYFYLTSLLLDLVDKSEYKRIIIVASRSHSDSIDFDNLQGEKYFEFFPMYMQSKFCNFLFTYKLAEYLEGTGITVNCLHPGLVNSNIDPLRSAEVVARAVPVEEGTQTILYLATSQDLTGTSGKYFLDDTSEAESKPATYDKTLQKQLWNLSEELVGEKFKVL